MEISDTKNRVNITTEHMVQYKGESYFRQEVYLSDATNVLSHTITWEKSNPNIEVVEHYSGQSQYNMEEYGWLLNGNVNSGNPTPEIELEFKKTLNTSEV